MVDKTPTELASHLAERIKKAVSDSGMSYEAVGEHVGVSKTSVSKWTKKGQIELPNLWRLSEVVGKPIAWFFPGYGDTPADGDADQDAALLLSKLVLTNDSGMLEDLLFEVLAAKRELKDS